MNILKDLNKRVNLKWTGILSIILGVIFYFLTDGGWALGFTVTIFVLLTLSNWMTSHQNERERKWKDDKYGDDPDWAIYKDLKKKFRQ